MANLPDIKAQAEMLIRKPAKEVFEAIIDPEITSKFWFSKGSGKLENGKTVQWDWEMYGFSMPAKVISIEGNKSIAVEWGEGNDASVIEWILTPRNDETTYVHINNYGFKGGLSAVV